MIVKENDERNSKNDVSFNLNNLYSSLQQLRFGDIKLHDKLN